MDFDDDGEAIDMWDKVKAYGGGMVFGQEFRLSKSGFRFYKDHS